MLYSGVAGKKVLWAFDDLNLPLDGQMQVRDVPERWDRADSRGQGQEASHLRDWVKA